MWGYNFRKILCQVKHCNRLINGLVQVQNNFQNLKTTTISLTDIIAVLSWPKNWTIKNVSTHLSFFFLNFMPLLHQLFGQNRSLSGSAGI
jgi:hypothetical protein